MKHLPPLLACLLTLHAAHASDWPEGYVTHRDSGSPDGQFAIAVPGKPDDSSTGDSENYLGDRKNHKLLGKITGSDYFEGQNHRGLTVIWAPDSQRCVTIYEGRYGYDKIILLEVKASTITQTDLTKHINKGLADAAGDEGTGSAFARFSPGDKLLVRALCFTGNPKMMDDSSKQARFAGTFDLKSRKWTASESHRIKNWDALSDAYSGPSKIAIAPGGDHTKLPPEFTGTIVDTDEEKAELLDRDMNTVYNGVRALLPPERFAKVREAQITWLKLRDAASSAAEKCQLLEARIKILQNLLW